MSVLPDKYTQKTEERVFPLDRIYFYLTEGCNLACRHCWMTPEFDVTGKRSLPVELFEAAIREAGPLGLSAVKLTGGEPLLHPQFTKLLEIVRHEDLGLIIETNGVLCTPEIAAEIAKSPRRFVSVSIDGADAETHENIRGVPGSFKQARQAVRNLVAANTRPQMIMSLMRSNVAQVDAVVSMAEKLGASSLKFNIVQPTGRGERVHEAGDLEIAELIELGHYVETELASKTALQLFFDYPPAFRSLSRIAGNEAGGICGILEIVGVIAGGHYALCGIGESVSELVFGSVGEERLAAIWRENVVLDELRTGLPGRLTGVCSRCFMKYQCLGTCIAQNYYRTKSLWSPFWFCEQAESIGLFPESRLGDRSS
ncbi:MAG: SynChlorMet cassette radical SAM/SPASM protein ScmF [bacterium]|nr:SynChlorMet cassette radical SAM/SPASM protein ScmF [bacterium]